MTTFITTALSDSAMAFEYCFTLESSNLTSNFKFDRYDTYQWYLRLGPLSNADANYFHGKIPTWNNFVAHPNYDEFWQAAIVWRLNSRRRRCRSCTSRAGGTRKTSMVRSRPMRFWKKLTQTPNYLVAGPWNHGGWNRLTGDKLGNIDFGSPASQFFRSDILHPWFALLFEETKATESAAKR